MKILNQKNNIMKILIQKVDGKIVHDFGMTLLESIRYNNWLTNSNEMKVKTLNYVGGHFKPHHKNYVPIGSVEFVSDFLLHFYGLTPKPINVPEDLIHNDDYDFVNRKIFNGTHMDLEDLNGKFFVKSNDKIKKIRRSFKTRG